MRAFFSYDSYKHLILDKIRSLPDKGRGVTQKLAEHMRVNPSFVSQVVKGDKHFSAEQIFAVARYFSFNNLERDFLLTLLSHERAGTHDLKTYYGEHLEELRKKSKFVSKRLAQKTRVSDQDQARYYSDWVYSAVRILCTRDKVTLTEICKKFGLSSQRASEIVGFLVESGLLVTSGNYLKSGVKNTHLPAHSPFIVSHHKNWRLKAMTRHPDLKEDELAFSAPFGVGREDFVKIKDNLLDLISTVSQRVNDSPTEDLACLNIDLFFV